MSQKGARDAKVVADLRSERDSQSAHSDTHRNRLFRAATRPAV